MDMYIVSCLFVFFFFSRNCQTTFQGEFITLHFHQQYVKHSVAPFPHQNLILPLLLTLALLIGVQQYLVILTVYISLISSDAENLSI